LRPFDVIVIGADRNWAGPLDLRVKRGAVHRDRIGAPQPRSPDAARKADAVIEPQL